MEKNLNNLNTISYKGQVKIKAIDGKRTLYSYTSHNAGKQSLFNFLASCLIGNFVAARDNMPCRIACFNKQEGAATKKVSTYVYVDSSRCGSTSDGAEVIFRFRIPYTCLVGGETINYFELFPNIPTGNNSCAEFKLNEEIQIPSSGGNFTIVVEWKMILKDVSSN